MNASTSAETMDVNAALWIGALMLASSSIRTRFPPRVGEESAALELPRFPELERHPPGVGLVAFRAAPRS